MKRFALLSIFTSILLSSCGTLLDLAYKFEPDSPYAAFEGRVRNVESRGQNEEVFYQVAGHLGLGLVGGELTDIFSFNEPDICLCFFVPYHPGDVKTFDTRSENVTVKMLRGDYSVIAASNDVKKAVENVKLYRGENLTGTLTHWYKEGKFEMTINLESESGVAFKGVFRSPFERERFLQWPGTQAWHKKPDAD